MNGTDYFRVVHGEAHHIGELEPSGTTVPWEIGCSMVRTDPEVCTPSNGDHTGFLTKKVTTDGPSFEDMNFNKNLPAKLGQKVSLAQLPDGALIEVEGEPSITATAASPGLIVTSGTGAITGATARASKLSFKNGRVYLAQTGDYIFGVLREQMTPIASASNIRILIEIRRAAKVE